jgi:hypothetical protein
MRLLKVLPGCSPVEDEDEEPFTAGEQAQNGVASKAVNGASTSSTRSSSLEEADSTQEPLTAETGNCQCEVTGVVCIAWLLSHTM